MHYKFIVNPAAGRYRAGKKYHKLAEILESAGLDFEIVVTQKPGHATELAHEAALEADAVIAVGGDGTIQEVSAGIVASGRSVHLGIVPLGTGNDFIKMIGMPRDLGAAIKALAGAKPVSVDYGRVSWEEGSLEKSSVFVNAVGVGFDAIVADSVASFKTLPGLVAYLAAVLHTLKTWDAPKVRVVAGSKESEQNELYEGPFFLATAGNGASSGGGFYLTPSAAIDDAILDLCIVEDVTISRVLQLIPRVMRGRHTAEPEVHMHKEQSIGISSDSCLPVHADGEVISKTAINIDVEIIGGGLSVLMPNNFS